MDKSISKQNNRYTVIDILRALSIIAMVIYHTLWDLIYIYQADIPFFHSKGAYIFQQSILWTFVIISGFCCSFGKHKLRRALYVMCGSFAITLVTYIFSPDSLILFGVLTFISSAMIIMIPLDKLLSKVNPIIGMIISFLLFAVTKNAMKGYIGLFNLKLLCLPDVLYANYLTSYLGFPHAGFFSSDYVPIIPWIFLYIFGYFMYQTFKKHDLLKHLSIIKCKPLEFIGRHSLIIYLLHQVIIYAVLYLIFNLI